MSIFAKQDVVRKQSRYVRRRRRKKKEEEEEEEDRHNAILSTWIA